MRLPISTLAFGLMLDPGEHLLGFQLRPRLDGSQGMRHGTRPIDHRMVSFGIPRLLVRFPPPRLGHFFASRASKRSR